MNAVPTYDSTVPKQYYDTFGEKEWTKLSRDPARELLLATKIRVPKLRHSLFSGKDLK